MKCLGYKTPQEVFNKNLCVKSSTILSGVAFHLRERPIFCCVSCLNLCTTFSDFQEEYNKSKALTNKKRRSIKKTAEVWRDS